MRKMASDVFERLAAEFDALDPVAAHATLKLWTANRAPREWYVDEEDLPRVVESLTQTISDGADVSFSVALGGASALALMRTPPGDGW
jgi:hypothetical protein